MIPYLEEKEWHCSSIKTRWVNGGRMASRFIYIIRIVCSMEFHFGFYTQAFRSKDQYPA